ncbi:MAG: FKBP-type peptidyl-prolyl cis-trans isomerase [Actinomycetota bacterium]|nr:FKBP-type peptidyl-prolyl cis-trans isomerase [Actinomycetota bacterium]
MKTIVAGCAVALLLVAGCGDGGAPACEEGAEVTTESRLRYEEIECGTGTEAARGDVVLVHYTGRFEDGSEFDTSGDGPPTRFFLESGNAIEGWVEGVAGMKEGGRRELTIPPDLGYGEAGFPPEIPGNATLVFEVELVEVEER